MVWGMPIRLVVPDTFDYIRSLRVQLSKNGKHILARAGQTLV